MRVYLKAFIMNLTKNNEEITRSSFIPGRLNKIEKEMKAGKITVDEVIVQLKDEDKFRKVFSDSDWRMITKEIEKMIK